MSNITPNHLKALKKANSKPVKAINVATGEETVYPSQNDACLALGVRPPAISRALANDGTAAGYRFERVENEN